MSKFSEYRERANLDGEICSVGISPHAINQLGDIVFVELSEIGKIVDKDDALLYDLTSITPEGAMENWLARLKITDINALDHLMDEDA